jgi:hypothetical protein
MRLRISPSPITAMPLTLACWRNGVATSDASLYVGSDDDGSERENWQLTGAVSGGNKVAAGTRDAAGATFAVSALPMVPRWYHAAATFESTTSRTGWMNGDPGTPETTSRDPAAGSIECMTIGIEEKFTVSNYLGDIFWPCFWSVILEAWEMMHLASGVPPWHVRPESIVACPDMLTGWDPFLGVPWEIINAPPVSKPPREWVPPVRTIPTSAAAAAGGSVNLLQGPIGLPRRKVA